MVALIAAATLARHGQNTLALAGAGFGVVCLGWARWEHRLACRARIGARSEQLVRRTLGALEREGWEIRHSLRWPDRRWGGDIDHVAVAPDIGLAFVIETKTRTYDVEHLQRTRACAEWVARRWRLPGGAYAVLSVTRGRSRCDIEEGVIVVSVDRLVEALRATAESGVAQAARAPASVLMAIERWIGA